MKRSKFSDEQIVSVVQQVEAGVPISIVRGCRLFDLQRSTYDKRSSADPQDALRQGMRELAEERRTDFVTARRARRRTAPPALAYPTRRESSYRTALHSTRSNDSFRLAAFGREYSPAKLAPKLRSEQEKLNQNDVPHSPRPFPP
jgi:hypothetical protein